MKLNCAAIPLGLLESELFGHERGAFTGAEGPRNVRELQNFIERAVILSPQSILRAPTSELESFQSPQKANVPMNGLAEVERDHILRALEASNWVIGGQSGAAARLGMKRTSLVYRMKKLRIGRPAALPHRRSIGAAGDD